ncbi:MAG: type II toxin-antitoxin system prevent-host-death family antitoxin [Caldimonas sp.]
METQTIGLFEAKTHLSELVARAEQGGEIIITRHNKPVAKIVPLAEVAQFDKSKRRAAIAKIDALREELRGKHGSLSTEEIVSWVREGREERDEQIGRSATCKKR